MTCGHCIRLGVAAFLFSIFSGYTPSNAQIPSRSPTDSQPTQTQELLWNHNGSTVYLVMQGRSRKFFYKEPRSGILSAGAKPGSLLFEGEAIGERFEGTAYLFNSRCGQLPYRVSGPILDNSRRVELRGQAPRTDDNCQITGYVNDLLAFQLIAPEVAPTISAMNDEETAKRKNAEVDAANRAAARAEVTRRATEKAAQLKAAEVEAAKRTAAEAADKAAEHQRQMDDQRTKLFTMYIILALLGFIGALALFGLKNTKKIVSDPAGSPSKTPLSSFASNENDVFADATTSRELSTTPDAVENAIIPDASVTVLRTPDAMTNIEQSNVNRAVPHKKDIAAMPMADAKISKSPAREKRSKDTADKAVADIARAKNDIR